jgi:hypothetical protein
MLPQISVLFTSLMGCFRKTEFPSLASKSLMLAVVAGFIGSDLNSSRLSIRRILTKVIRPILFLSGSGPTVPNLGRVTKCS